MIPLPHKDTVLTVSEVAMFLKVSETTIYRLAKTGKLPARKVGGAWRFSQFAIQQWLHVKTPAMTTNNSTLLERGNVQ